jgi:hypothetical protein
VAGIAIRSAGYRGVRHMVSRLATRRRVGSCMAGCALIGHGQLGMVPRSGPPDGKRGTVAAYTIGGGREVRSILAHRRSAVVASRTNRCRSIGSVIRFGTQPGRGAAMAALAIARD